MHTDTRDFIRLLHDVARRSEVPGELVLASFGQDPVTEKNVRPRIRRFAAGAVDEHLAEIERLAADQHRNIYTGLYLVRPDLEPGRKGEEADVVAVLGICADFDAKDDPRAARWADRMPVPPTLVMQTSATPAPSFQAMLLFDQPMTNLERAKSLAVRFTRFTECDAISQDISHVWRIPKLLNWPNKLKVDAGRPAAPQLVEMLTPLPAARPIDVDTLEQALPAAVPSGPAGSRGRERAQVDITLETLPRVDPAHLGLSQKYVDMILDPTPYLGGEYESRSEATFAVACALARVGRPDDEIAAVLLDERFGISAHAREQGRGPIQRLRYVRRQVQRARDHGVAPELAELNERHAFVMVAGHGRIFRQVYEPNLKRWRWVRMSNADFQLLYCNRQVDVGADARGNPRRKPLGKWWMENPGRRQYPEGLTFLPCDDDTPGWLNLWTGFSVEAAPGDWSKFRHHIEHNICGDDPELIDYLMGWMATMFQHPDQQGEVAVVLRGKKGSGKSVFANALGRLISEHYLQISNSRHLTGNFNAHLQDTVLLFADEAFWAGDKTGESVLKTLITEPVLPIEAKGIDMTTCRNYVHLIMASNHDWVAPASEEERRFFVLDVGTDHLQDHEYFAALHAQLTDGGYAALLYDLLNYDLSKFNVRMAPRTSAITDQKVHSLPDIVKWWYDKLVDGQTLHGVPGWQTSIPRSTLQDDYIGGMDRSRVNRRSSAVELGMFLKSVCPTVKSEYKRTTWDVQDDHGRAFTRTAQRSFYVFPDLHQTRQAFSDAFPGLNILWNDAGDDQPELGE